MPTRFCSAYDIWPFVLTKFSALCIRQDELVVLQCRSFLCGNPHRPPFLSSLADYSSKMTRNFDARSDHALARMPCCWPMVEAACSISFESSVLKLVCS